MILPCSLIANIMPFDMLGQSSNTWKHVSNVDSHPGVIRHGKLSRNLLAIFCVMLIAVSPAALAAKLANVTEAELALIPSYCPDTQGFKYGDSSYKTSPNAAKWVNMMGKGFWAVHHHCWGIIEYHRAMRANVPTVQKQGNLSAAVNDFWYVVQNTPSDFILLPEIFTWIGRAEVALGHADKAGEAFERARQIKPDYWPAYSHWAEYLIFAGKRQEAKNIVKSGLEYTPTARVLVEQYRLLGGKLSDIVPKVLPSAEADSVATPPGIDAAAEEGAVSGDAKSASPAK